MATLPAISNLASIIFDNGNAERFLFDMGVFYSSIKCPTCDDLIVASLRHGFRCQRRQCLFKRSIRVHTFFAGSKLGCGDILHLGWLWLNRNSQTQAINATGFSGNTVTSFFKHFRQLVSSTLDDHMQKIGGEGIVVEIDETKLGKRKYHRGHRVEGVWVLVGVEQTPQRKVFARKVENRQASTLEEIIQEHVLPGSIIHTDLWKGYSNLQSNLNFIHKTVNHSKFFKDPITNVHINTAEGTNNGLKILIRPRNRTKEVDDHLSEFVWRRLNSDKLWNSFIAALKDIHYDLA